LTRLARACQICKRAGQKRQARLSFWPKIRPGTGYADCLQGHEPAAHRGRGRSRQPFQEEIMAITRYQTGGDVFGSLLDNFITPPPGARHGNLLRAPEADVMESEGEIRVMVEMPGVQSEGVDVSLENNILTISGEKHERREEGDDGNTWHLTERRYGKFARSFVLPRDVEQDAISASMNEGVLTVVIPKSERARRRRIEIRNGGGQQRVETGSSES
jgi:HSP20 family molecular chaperone IbpA